MYQLTTTRTHCVPIFCQRSTVNVGVEKKTFIRLTWDQVAAITTALIIGSENNNGHKKDTVGTEKAKAASYTSPL